jgi:hypothetical protein
LRRRARLPALALMAAAATAAPGAAEQPLVLAAPGAVLAFVPDDLAGVEVFTEDGRAMLALRLGPDAAARFAALTEAHAGSPLTVRVCGVELARPVPSARIDSGLLLVPAPAEAAVSALRGLGPCPDG